MNECAREITWAGGKHVFNLNDKRVLQMMAVRGLPGQFGDTPAACFKRFEEGVYSVEDVERIMAFGLIGGGMAARDVDAILESHVRQKPIAPNAIIAANVLTALFIGAEHDASA